jgi:hypothetical protein
MFDRNRAAWIARAAMITLISVAFVPTVDVEAQPCQWQCETFYDSEPRHYQGQWYCGWGCGLCSCLHCCCVSQGGENYCCVDGHCY